MTGRQDPPPPCAGKGDRGARSGATCGQRDRIGGWTLIALAGLLALTAPALPQQRARAPQAPAKEAPSPAPNTDAPAPYDRDLLRLSEIVGALALLRGLCASPDAAEWPARMKALLDAEGVTPARRDRLAGAYNRGYRGYALTYRICTPAAHEAASRFVAEGERLSHALAGRFGG